jgi:uncharacterized protein YneF (UPF0154 family)
VGKPRLNPQDTKAVMLKAGLKPLEPYKKVDTKWKCQCLTCKKIVYPRYADIQKRGGGCKWCATKKRADSRRVDEQTAVNMMLKAGLKPLEPYTNAHTKWKCIHIECGKIVYPTYDHVQRGQGGCKDCGFKKIGAKKRNNEADAIEVMKKAKLKPLEPYKGVDSKWKCLHIECGKIVYPTYYHIQRGQGGCAYCAGQIPDLNKINQVMKQAQLKPLEPYKTAVSKWKCKCLRCGKTVYPVYNTIQQGRGGCRYCATKGINMNVPSYLYLITNDELYSHKIGIGNHLNRKTQDRLSNFTKCGWQTYKVWQMKTGADALDIEAKIFKIIRKDLKIPVHLSREQMPKTEGQTETINADTITLVELEKIINKVIKGHRK